MLTREKLLELATIVREETEQGLNTAQRVGHLLYEIVSSFLSKTGDDTTDHKLTADELQVLSVLTVAGSQLIGTGNNDKAEIISSILGSQVVTGDQNVNGISNLIGGTYFGPKFVHGLQGTGGFINSFGAAELDSLSLRKWLEVPEMRLNRTVYIAGDLRQSWCNGTIETVQVLSESTGVFKLKLEDGEGGTCQKDDICMGMYQFGDGGDATEDTDDLKGNMTRAGFTTCYFRITSVSGKHNEIVSYSLRPYVREVTDPDTGKTEHETYYGNHPHRFMKFAGYGNFTNKTRQASTCITKSYIQFLRGVDDWEYTFKNIAMQMGELDGLYESYKDEGCPELSGYSAYLNNIYFSGKIAQVNEEAIVDIKEKIKNYNVNFSEHVDVITVDDVGNVIGGLYTKEVDSTGNTYHQYRIHSAITVRNNNRILTACGEDETAGPGTYKLFAQPHGCSCIIKDSTLYITNIDNLKDGVAGTADDESFDYDKMRRTEACSVDILVDCEGYGTITKSFPITIKHQSDPFIGADITNESSAVSWNTKAQRYVGLPIISDMRMWHNNSLLDTVKICVKTEDGKLIASSDNDDTVIHVPGLSITASIVNSILSLTDGTTEEGRIGHIEITAFPKDAASISNLYIVGEAVYAGVSYERTFLHTVRKSSDVNVYQLVPSTDQILSKFKDGNRVLDAEIVTCAVHCDSSDDKHYILTDDEIVKAGLKVQYSVDNGSTRHDYSTGIAIDSDISSVIFYLTQGNLIWDQETVPVILDGVDGKGVEFIFWLQESWREDSDNISDLSTPTILDDSTTTAFQEDNHCPYDIGKTDKWTDEPSGVGMNNRYEFYAMRKKANGVWQPFGEVKLWNKYTVDGKSNYVLDLTNDQSFMNCDEKGTILSAYEDTTIQLFKGTEYAWELFDISIEAHNISYSYVPGTHTIKPSNLTADSATIVVTATLKANTNIVLTTVYKINKAYAGKTGVIYSLLPSVNVIHKYADGNFVDTSMSVQVKKTAGETTTILSTKDEITSEGLVLNYLLGNTKYPVTNPATISTSNVCGSAQYATFVLMKGGEIVDRERVNCVSDGEKGDDGQDGTFRQDIFKLATAVPPTPTAKDDAAVKAQGWAKEPLKVTPQLTYYEAECSNDGVFSNVDIDYKGGDDTFVYATVSITAGGNTMSFSNVGVRVAPNTNNAVNATITWTDGTTKLYTNAEKVVVKTMNHAKIAVVNSSSVENSVEMATAIFTPTAVSATPYVWAVVGDSAGYNALSARITQTFRKSAAIVGNGLTKEAVTIKTTHNGDCVRICVVASSEKDYDSFYVGKPDRKYKAHPSTYSLRTSGDGVVSVVDVTFRKAGTHTVELLYCKDGSRDKFGDCGYYRIVGVFQQTERKLYYSFAKAIWSKKEREWVYGYNEADNTYGNWDSPVEYNQSGKKGSDGCIQRVWQTFTEGQIYRDDTDADESEIDSSGIRYLDFMAVADNSMASGWKIYQCVMTHEGGTDGELSDINLWKEVSVNAQSAFFTYLIAKNATIQMLSSSRFVVTNPDNTIVAGMGNSDIPLWVGGSNPSSAPFHVTREGILSATGAKISGDITALKGKIGPFTISDEGLYTGTPDDWWNGVKSNFVYLNTSSLLMQQSVGYFHSGDIANIKVGFGKGSDPTTEGNQYAYCSSAMYIYRNMNSGADNMYYPAAKIISDNVINRDIALRCEGGLQVWGGVIERGYHLEISDSGGTNVIDLSFGTTILVYSSGNKRQFFLPELSEIRAQLGIKDSLQIFCTPFTVVVRKDSNKIWIATKNKSSNHIDASRSGIIVDNNGNEWNGSNIESSSGDVTKFAACYSPSTGFYYQLLARFD